MDVNNPGDKEGYKESNHDGEGVEEREEQGHAETTAETYRFSLRRRATLFRYIKKILKKLLNINRYRIDSKEYLIVNVKI